MAFLDNSGDIILDAVLTDTGRLRLARGDGSFKITQFAFGDDEINYALYDKAHPSGSAYYDLEILQTPILEAFTNNASSMKSLLLSNPNSQLLYLPSLVLTEATTNSNSTNLVDGTFLVLADQNTVSKTISTGSLNDYLNGVTPTDSRIIYIDQGINTTQISNTKTVSGVESTLAETSFIIEINNNFITLCDSDGVNLSTGTNSALSYIDDDGMAAYSLTIDNTNVVTELKSATATEVRELTSLLGPRDKRIAINFEVKSDLQASTYLFTTYGGTTTISGIGDCYYIDTFVSIKGQTTGTSITIPLRIVKKQ
jgi:hypothetical protein